MRQNGSGRDAAFEEFVRNKQVALVRFAWLVSDGSYAHAEDLVQEALIRLYGRWSDVNDPEAYTRTTISRLNISVWRKLRRETLRGTPVDRAELDRRLDALGGDGRLIRAVRALPPRQRLVIVLRYWCDYGDGEIAETLGCAQATVRSLAHRGLTRLREVWPPPTQTTTQSITGRTA